MKKSEMKQLIKEAMAETLNESFIPSIIEMVVRTTEKTVERKLDENIKKVLGKNFNTSNVSKKKVVRKKKTTTQKKQVKKVVTPVEEVRFSKDPVINKMLQETLVSTSENQLSDFGSEMPDLQNFNGMYEEQSLQSNEAMTPQASTLTENLELDTLRGSVMDNAALAGVFKKDYRKTLKQMEKSSAQALPEAVQFFEAK